MRETCINCQRGIRVLLRVMQEKSLGLFVHSIYTGLLAKRIAEDLDMSREDIQTIYLAGLLHDIGKTSLSQTILLKDSALTKEEFEIIKLHPRKSSELLMSAGIFEHIAEYIFCHHELPGGDGYPMGLKNSAIPFESKIIAIADKHAALTQRKPYRDAFRINDSISFLSGDIKGFFNGKENIVAHALESSVNYSFSPFVMKAMNNYDLLFPSGGV